MPKSLIQFVSVFSMALLCCCGEGCGRDAYAETPNPHLSQLRIGGLGAKEVEKRFGAPDSRMKPEKGSLETWLYANSKILFQDGKVMLWDDESGELERRNEVSNFQVATPEQRVGSAAKGWVNDWTPPVKPKAEKVIESLLEN